MGADGARLSKRFGAVAVSDYRGEGFLPEALVNYLMLLGWSPGNQEIVGLQAACAKFSIKKVNKTAAQFNMEKLKWTNGQYIKASDTARLTDFIIPLLQEEGLIPATYDRAPIEAAVQLFKGRMLTLRDFIERAGFLFMKELSLSDEIKVELGAKDLALAFGLLADRLEKVEPFDVASAENVFRALVAELGMASGDLVHPVRLAISASTVGPGLFETMAVLGRERTVGRLRTVFKT